MNIIKIICCLKFAIALYTFNCAFQYTCNGHYRKWTLQFTGYKSKKFISKLQINILEYESHTISFFIKTTVSTIQSRDRMPLYFKTITAVKITSINTLSDLLSK